LVVVALLCSLSLVAVVLLCSCVAHQHLQAPSSRAALVAGRRHPASRLVGLGAAVLLVVVLQQPTAASVVVVLLCSLSLVVAVLLVAVLLLLWAASEVAVLLEAGLLGGGILALRSAAHGTTHSSTLPTAWDPVCLL
jgi:hypothetical protein